MRSVWSASIPVAMGYVPLGAIFGVLFVQAGGPWWLALLVSVWVYAGSAQYALVPMLAAGLGAWSVAMAVALINLRHVFYGLSLLEHQPKQPWARAYLMFALTDETYSVVTTWPKDTAPMQIVWLAMLHQGWWVLGTLLGCGLATLIPTDLQGLDFSMAALFAVLCVEQWRRTRQSVLMWVAAGLYVLCAAVLERQVMLTAMVLSAIMVLLWGWWQFRLQNSAALPTPRSSEDPS